MLCGANWRCNGAACDVVRGMRVDQKKLPSFARLTLRHHAPSRWRSLCAASQCVCTWCNVQSRPLRRDAIYTFASPLPLLATSTTDSPAINIIHYYESGAERVLDV